MVKRLQRGFTLIEVIVAMAIMAVIATMAYGSLSQVVRTQHIIAEQGEVIDTLQRAVTILERDFLQMMPRAIRTTFGSFSPAMISDGSKVSFTRTGRKYIQGYHQGAQSAMSRVSYFLDGGKLVRETWPVLDQAHSTVSHRLVVLRDVVAFKVQFLSKEGWRDTWPLPKSQDPKDIELDSTLLPKFVRLDIEIQDLGTLTRLLPGAG